MNEQRIILCDYCGDQAKLVGGDIIYPHRPDLYSLKYWHCEPCSAYVGCHKGSKTHAPLGRLADSELRIAKQQAHAAFDPLWKLGFMTRKEAYLWLRDQLGFDKIPHIGFMSVADCQRVIQIIEGKQK